MKIDKMKLINDLTFDAYRTAIDNTAISMFTWTGLPDTVPADILENILLKKGRVVLFNYNGDWIVCPFSYAADPDVYGYGRKIIATSKNGHTWEFDRVNDAGIISIGWNNSKSMPDLLNLMTAETLTELHKSIRLNVLYSRLKPIMTATDDKAKLVIEKAIKDLIDGKLESTIISDNFLKMIDERGKTIDRLDISDVETATKLQYLFKAFEDTQRLLYTFNGQAIQGNGKMAQQTVDEVNGATSASFIYPKNKLIHRQKFAADLQKFGLNVTVDFSEEWQIERDKYGETDDKDSDDQESDERDGDEDVSEEEAKKD